MNWKLGAMIMVAVVDWVVLQDIVMTASRIK